ncbi:hypothetical protein [Borrelia persica]|uniref:hypothetical protein n=1 Tax=Borrelia persica TaxID=44448 RepID=UPI000464A860|nr:hypothetical protein [Borrelia persica]
MDLYREDLTGFRKIRFFLLSFFLLIFIILLNSLFQSKIGISVSYKFSHFSKYDGLVEMPSNNIVFVQDQILNLDLDKYYYHVLSDRLVSVSELYYVLGKFQNSYSVYSKKTDKFLFSLSYRDLVFTKGNAIFALNNLYKILEVYGEDGNQISSFKFVASILSVDYNNDVLVVGLSDGNTYVYKHGKMIYSGDLLDRGFLPIICVKLSFDNKYLCILRQNELYSLEVINLENGYNQVLYVTDLKLKDFNPFLKIDKFYNLFVKTVDSFLILNVRSGRTFRINNENSVLKACYDSLSNVYRVYFYDLSSSMINIRTYSVDSYNLFDNIFFKDRIRSYIEFDKGILYFNDKNDLKYLGL